jgi:hypothetical protein
MSWDSTSKGKSTLNLSCPVFINTQGFGESVLNYLSIQTVDNIKPDGGK